MNTNYEYHYYPIYKVYILNVENASISCESYVASYNDWITVYVENVNEGIKVNSIYVIDESSNEVLVEISNNHYRFKMPKADCYIGLNYTYLTYTVKFLVDDGLYSEATYRYGEEIVLPTKPLKLSDEKYSYEFSGWNPGLEENVTKDMVYNAVFKRIPTTLKPIEQQTSIIKTALIIGVSIVVLIGGGIVALVLYRKRKNKKKKK